MTRTTAAPDPAAQLETALTNAITGLNDTLSTLRRRRHTLPATLTARQLLDTLPAIRRNLGITQAQVARHMGISQSALSNLEAGNSQFTLSQLTRYAETLGVVIDFTLTAREAAA